MATEKELYELIGRAVVDHDFRAKLKADPEQAAQAAGYALTAEQLAALTAEDGKGLVQVLDERLPKSASGGCAGCRLGAWGLEFGAYGI